MSEYKLKTPKQAEAVVGACHKVEDTVVGGYKAIEKKFVDAFLEKTDGDGQDAGNPPLVKE